MDLLICLDVKGACISQKYHQTLKRRTGIFQNTPKWSLSSSLASAVPSKPSQERLASRFLAQQPLAIGGPRFSESKLFEHVERASEFLSSQPLFFDACCKYPSIHENHEIAMTLITQDSGWRNVHFTVVPWRCHHVFKMIISSKTTHPHCRCILRFFSTAQTPQKFGITSPFSSLMRFVTWRGALTWLGARHSISELKSLVVGCMIPTKKMSYILSIRFVSCYLLYICCCWECLLKLSFCQRIHGPWKIETYIILAILMVMMKFLSFAWTYLVRCVIALYCYW